MQAETLRAAERPVAKNAVLRRLRLITDLGYRFGFGGSGRQRKMSRMADFNRRGALAGAGLLTLAALSGCSLRPSRAINVLYFAGLAEGARIRANLPEFEKRANVAVNFEELPYDAIRPRQLQSFSRKAADYDVVFVDDVWMYEYASRGYLTDLSGRVAADGLDMNDFGPKVLAAESMLDGHTWLIPQRADVQVLFYNKAIFGDAALDELFRKRTGKPLAVPQTWADYAATSRTLNGAQRGGATLVGCAETLKRPHFAFEFFATRYWSISGLDFFDPHGRPLFDSPGGVDALDFLVSLKDVWAPGSLNASHDETKTALVSGRVAMAPQWFASYADLKKAQGGLGANLGVALMPGVATPEGIRRAPSIGGGSLGISRNSAHQDEAWAFIKFMTSPEIMRAGALDGEIVPRR
jgi:multiple sugar transport system substrate-binding protein